jgi:hypothetical protein
MLYQEATTNVLDAILLSAANYVISSSSASIGGEYSEIVSRSVVIFMKAVWILSMLCNNG